LGELTFDVLFDQVVAMKTSNFPVVSDTNYHEIWGLKLEASGPAWGPSWVPAVSGPEHYLTQALGRANIKVKYITVAGRSKRSVRALEYIGSR